MLEYLPRGENMYLRNSFIFLSFLFVWSCSNNEDLSDLNVSVSGSDSIGLINDERILEAESEMFIYCLVG